MAKQEATLLLKIKESGSKALDDLKKRFVITAGDIVNAFKKVVAVISEYVGKAVELEGVAYAFRNLAASQNKDADSMLAKMRELSHGMISDLELMKQANQAMLLGLPVDRFGDMLTIARSAAKSTGQSMEFMLQSIVTGLGRGSKLMLDNLGILVNVDKAYEKYAISLGKTAKELTETEKKQAFINEALNIGTKNAQAAGVTSNDLGSQWAKLKAKSENLATSLAGKFLPILESIVYAGNKWIEMFEYFFPDDAPKSAAQLSIEIVKLKDRLTDLNDELASSGGLNNIKGHIQTQIALVKKSISELEAEREAAAQRELELEDKKRQGIIQKELQLAEERKALAIQNALDAETKRQESLELELASMGLAEEEKLALRLQYLEKKIAQEEDAENRLLLLSQKYDLLKEAQKAKHDKIMEKQEQAYQQARVNILSGAANLITAMMGRESKAAFLAQQAAALAGAIVATNLAAAQALAVPPAPNLGLAALAKAAGAINIAAIGAQTVKGLAEGGIVRARPGGMPAIIGEGGRDEAVVPLPDDFDPDNGLGGGNLTVNFNGPIMGDEVQARELAKMLDRQLLELRRSNESVAFDSDVT